MIIFLLSVWQEFHPLKIIIQSQLAEDVMVLLAPPASASLGDSNLTSLDYNHNKHDVSERPV